MAKNASDYRDEARDLCNLCQDAFQVKVEALENEVTALKDKRDELLEDVERITKERNSAEQRHAELVETVSTRTDQAKA